MSENRSSRADLDRLADALVEDILTASDDEILAEAREDYGDPAAVAAEVHEIYERAILLAKKNRLAAARDAVRRNNARGRKLVHLEPREARLRLEAALAKDPNAKMTLAAREGKELSDADVLGMLEDLEALGIDTSKDDEE